MTQNLYLRTDDSPQGRVPVVLQRPSLDDGAKLPVVIFLHATGSSKEAMAARMAQYAADGFLAAAVDCRYHGERARAQDGQHARDVYQDALVRAWREGVERPFLLDTVWDLLHLLDYLCARQDVDPQRIGMTGVSLGGMHTWLCAAADERVAAAAPVIGVQGFAWAVAHSAFQARVDSIARVFQAAARDLGQPSVDAEVVRAVWDRIVPGLLDQYDSPASLPLIAPRPLFVLNGELDPRCPLPGLEEALASAASAYSDAGVADRLSTLIQPGVGHQETEEMRQLVFQWMGQVLQPRCEAGA